MVRSGPRSPRQSLRSSDANFGSFILGRAAQLFLGGRDGSLSAHQKTQHSPVADGAVRVLHRFLERGNGLGFQH